MHQKKFFILATVLSVISVNAYSSNINELQTVTMVSQSMNKPNQKDIWPEFNIKETPIVIYFKNKHNYAYNFSPTSLDWKKVENQIHPIYYIDHDLYEINNLPWSNGNFIDGQASFIFNIDGMSDNDIDSVHTLFHERFHIFQFQNFPEEIYNFGTYDGFNYLENIKLTYIEDAALTKYLTTSNIEALKDYSAINQYREKVIGTNSSEYESKKENLEGLAEYYGWNMAIADKTERNSKIISIYQDKCDIDKLIKCQLHDRYYFTGAVLGIALDQLTPVIWKEKLVKNKLSIRKQLFHYFSMTEQEIQNRVQQAKINYHYNEITRSVENIIQDYKKQRQDKLDKYNNSDAISMNIEKRPCNLFGMIESQKTYYLDSDTQLILGNSGNSSCSDESIKINYHKTPYTLQTEHSGEIQIKIGRETKINCDDRTIYADDLVKTNAIIDFNNFYLNDSTIEIAIKNRYGQLKSINGSLFLITNMEN